MKPQDLVITYAAVDSDRPWCREFSMLNASKLSHYFIFPFCYNPGIIREKGRNNKVWCKSRGKSITPWVWLKTNWWSGPEPRKTLSLQGCRPASALWHLGRTPEDSIDSESKNSLEKKKRKNNEGKCFLFFQCWTQNQLASLHQVFSNRSKSTTRRKT